MKYTPLLRAIFLGVLFTITLSMCTNPFMEKLLRSGKINIPVVGPDITYYTVSFNSMGGSEVPSQTVVEDETAIRPDNPTKVEDGIEFGFVNWYDNEGLTEPHYNFATPVTRDITLYAKWSDIFFTVTFDSNGGSDVDKQIVGEGGTAREPSQNPTRDGFEFGGWYSDEALTIAYDFETQIFAAITLFANWVPVFTVTFDANAGTDTVSGLPAPISVRSGTTISKPDDPSRAGYTFVGWYREAAGINAWDFGAGTVTANISLYAKWDTIPVTGVTLNKTTLTLHEGDVEILTATVEPGNASNKNVSWTSSNSGVAAVGNDGMVEAKSAGTATITVTTQNGGKTATCTVVVEAANPGDIAVTGVSLNKTSISLTVGSSETLTPIVAPSDATNKNVSWRSSDTDVATVGNDGTVEAKAAGTATITVTTQNGGKTATCTVTVSEAIVAVSGVTLNTNTLALAVGGSGTLIPTVVPDNATNKTITWSSSNDAVATILNGTVTAIAEGTATITVSTADGNHTASCTVTVHAANPGDIAVSGVTLNASTLALDVGGSETLTASITPDDATNKTITWSSSNSVVATVLNGTVTALAAGTATITVTTEDGGHTATCTVTVTNVISTATISITVKQIEDQAPNIPGGTISRNSTGGYDKTITFALENPGLYTSYQWSIDGAGVNAGTLITLSNAASCTVDAGDSRYNTLGRHAVYLVVYKGSVPYSKTIWVEIMGDEYG